MVDFTPETSISVKFSNLNNFGLQGVEGWNFQGLIISILSTNSEKNEQNLRGKGVNIQKYWMIWHGITLMCSPTVTDT